MKRALSLFSLFAIAAAACGDNGVTDGNVDMAMGPDLARPPLGQPIESPKNTWTWVDFADSACENGTPTGVGIYRTDSPNLLVFLNGGGACWDYLTCYVLNTAAKGPFGKTEFDKLSGNIAGSVFDPNDSNNPFKGWNMVFVPYCTGDVHTGDNVATYEAQGQKRTYHHKGRANLTAYLKRLAPTFGFTEKIVVSGASAGGYGAAFNYDLFRTYFPSGKGYLVDDSGPVLVGDGIPPSYRAAWYMNWRMDKVLDPICPDCKNDLSKSVPIPAGKYANDRLALLSSTRDQTIRTYMQKTPEAFEAELNKLLDNVLKPIPNYRFYVETGEFHTFLGKPGSHNAGGVNLNTWLGKMVGDDSGWTSVRP